MNSLNCQPCGVKSENDEMMVGIKIEELTSRGFIEVIIIEVETPESDTKKQNKAISEMIESLYENEKFFMVIDSGVGVSIRGLDKKTIKISKVMKSI
jgi:hypothetical protein